ncbi:hypothetical protein EU538_06830 [Candidatus Thorarchaeota archaeon]|nr:MAG: hypothetical protein EU538_06830 [Candidatus Thorarchaeota archaeon]
MQTLLDIATTAAVGAGILSILVSMYLLGTWHRQENRIWTDLPLLFGIAFLVLGFNVVFIALQGAGILPDTMELFRIRSVIVAGTVIPLLIAVLHIWLPRFKHRFSHIVAVVSVYWILVSFLGPSRELIMMMNIPLMLVFVTAVLATFIVTWKTNRLQEIRSDLMVLSSILLLISQVSKIVLIGLGLGFVSDGITTLGVISAAIGITNPWFDRTVTPGVQAVASSVQTY